MEALVHATAGWIALALDALAVLTVAAGALEALARVLGLCLRGAATPARVHAAFIGFGDWLVVALTFQLAADIVGTTIAPGWDELGRLAAIAAIRTFLTFFLDHDLARARARELAEQERNGAQPVKAAPRDPG